MFILPNRDLWGFDLLASPRNTHFDKVFRKTGDQKRDWTSSSFSGDTHRKPKRVVEASN
uniref:Uncharacterized protein n=1 Tax=Anguilla anguilla TaxID=7936 RepID=A0A0E9S805_ANGAN